MSSVSDMFGGLLEGLAVPFTSIAEGLANIWDSIKNIPTLISNGIETIGNFFSGLISSIGDFFVNLGESISNLGTFIIDGIKDLFIPNDNFFDDLKEDLDGILKVKLGFVYQLKDVLDSFVSVLNGSISDKPHFDVTLYGDTYDIFDFEAFDIVRYTIQAIIIAICYIEFAKKMYYKLPSFIGNYYGGE